MQLCIILCYFGDFAGCTRIFLFYKTGIGVTIAGFFIVCNIEESSAEWMLIFGVRTKYASAHMQQIWAFMQIHLVGQVATLKIDHNLSSLTCRYEK